METTEQKKEGLTDLIGKEEKLHPDLRPWIMKGVCESDSRENTYASRRGESVMSQKSYTITRTTDGKVVCVVTWRSGKTIAHYPLHHIVYHSPTGFEVGYCGSGPADLSLSLLADWLEEGGLLRGRRWGWEKSAAWRYHQDFKFEKIAGIRLNPEESFTLRGDVVQEWLDTKVPRP